MMNPPAMRAFCALLIVFAPTLSLPVGAAETGDDAGQFVSITVARLAREGLKAEPAQTIRRF